MKKIYRILFFLVFTLSSTYVFSQDTLLGVYSYNFREGTYFYNETIVLHPDGHFNYKMQSIMGVKIEIVGNWQKRDSSLILDSYPQRDKIIIRESFNKKRKGIIFNVEDKKGEKFAYHLYAILQNGDTLSLRDQFGQINIQEKIKSFWIEDTKGLKSPQKTMLSSVANIINVIFETQRVFENEDWAIIDKEKLNTRGLQGEFQKYYLIKEK